MTTLVSWIRAQEESKLVKKAENLLAPQKKSNPKTNEDYYGPPYDTISKRDRKQKPGSSTGKVYPRVPLQAGGPGSGCNPAAGDCGRKRTDFNQGSKGLSSRAQRAIESYVPVTPAKYQLAKKNERVVAKLVGGTTQPDNSPFDVLLGDIGIEVKTVIEAKNDKITMHPKSGGGSLARKRSFMRKNHLKKSYTVVIDTRGDQEKWYVKRGLGSFRFGNLPTLKNPKELRSEIV